MDGFGPEGQAERLGGSEAIVRGLCQRAQQGLLNRRRHAGHAAGQRRRRGLQMGFHQPIFGIGVERRIPGQHFVGNAGQAVDVAALVALPTTDLLRRRIEQGSDNAALPGEALGSLGPGNTEIHDLQRAAIGQHEVRRFDVAMDEALLMGIGQTHRGLRDNRQRVTQGQVLEGLQHVFQRAALHQLHHHVDLAIDLEQVVKRGDVWVR